MLFRSSCRPSLGGPFKPGFGLSGAFAFLSVIPVGNLLLVFFAVYARKPVISTEGGSNAPP
jgi:hypothetical protein